MGAEGTTVESDCVRWPHSVQWLDLGQSLVFSDLFGQYRTLLWSLCNRALWLQIHTPQTGNAAGSINLQDTHRGFLHHISQASKTGMRIMSGLVNIVEEFLYSMSEPPRTATAAPLLSVIYLSVFVTVVEVYSF